MIESEGQHAVITGDITHHPCQLAHPEWATSFDSDKETATATRTQLFAEWADQANPGHRHPLCPADSWTREARTGRRFGSRSSRPTLTLENKWSRTAREGSGSPLPPRAGYSSLRAPDASGHARPHHAVPNRSRILETASRLSRVRLSNRVWRVMSAARGRVHSPQNASRMGLFWRCRMAAPTSYMKNFSHPTDKLSFADPHP